MIKNGDLSQWYEYELNEDLDDLKDFLKYSYFDKKEEFLLILDNFEMVKDSIDALDTGDPFYEDDYQTRINALQYSCKDYMAIAKGYFDRWDIEGVVFYGSASTGYKIENSDLDLQIITNNDNPSNHIRGISTIDGIRIEYFEKPLCDYYNRAINDFNNQSNVLLSMIGHGVIIYDRNGNIKILQDYINEYYSVPLPCLSENDAKEMVAIINNRMIDLKTLYENNDPYFNHLYHLTIEKIKKFYHRLKGFPEISTSKTLKLYTDTTGYRERIFKTIPEQDFIDLYIDALDLEQRMTPQEKMDAIEKLYEYAKRDIRLDKDNYRIRINPRN